MLIEKYTSVDEVYKEFQHEKKSNIQDAIKELIEKDKLENIMIKKGKEKVKGIRSDM